jgi:hypothetical protein
MRQASMVLGTLTTVARVAFITTDDFRRIQLGLGFTLLGVGGMVAIYGPLDANSLHEGIRDDALDTLLFACDPGPSGEYTGCWR